MLIGDEPGLYRALAEGPATSTDLAEKTGTNERYIREWLGNQASGGYIEYDASTARYSMTEEQALCLANPNGPFDLPGAYMVVQDFFTC
jgi:DNA-binding IclR family transcriptional regulator